VQAVAATLAELLGDPDRRKRYGAAARERAVTEFSYDLLADQPARGIQSLAGAAK
jgi:glycosyltransferase involved in cell wall biosynthesis